MVTRVGVETIVLVIFKTLLPAGENHFKVPKPEEAVENFSHCPYSQPSIPIRMGCIRPAHPSKAEMEKGFIDSGVNTIAYPFRERLNTQKRSASRQNSSRCAAASSDSWKGY